MKSFIDFAYSVLIGIGVVLFVGLGIWTFYSGPKFPEYPQGPYVYKEPTTEQQKQMEAQQKKFDEQMKDFNNKKKPYARNVSIIAMVAGALFFAGGILLIKKNDVIGEGLALGGVFSEIYSVTRGAESSTKPLVFVGVCLVLAMLISLSVFRRKAVR